MEKQSQQTETQQIASPKNEGNSYQKPQIQNYFSQTRSNIYPSMKAKDSIYLNNLQDTLIDNRKKIIDLKYNSPTFKVQNIVAHGEQNVPVPYSPHVKLTQYSHVDHLASNYEFPIKRGLGKSDFNHLQNCTSQQIWKPSLKQIVQKPSDEYSDFQKKPNKNLTYEQKYARNPMCDDDKFVVQQGIKTSQKFKETSTDMKIIFTNGVQPIEKGQQQKQKTTTSIAKDKAATLTQAKSLFNYNTQGFEKQAQLKQNFGKKIDLNQKSKMENRNDFNSILNYDYGMPNKPCTEKINSFKPDQRKFQYNEVNPIDWRKQYNLLQKEEKYAEQLQIKQLETKNN